MVGTDSGVARLVKPAHGSANAARERMFATLVDRRAIDAAYRYATMVLGNRSDAEDATHDAALTAWQRFGDLRDVDRFEAWFGRILVNACRDRLRVRVRTPLSLDAEPVPDAASLGDRLASPDQADAIVRRQAIGAALRSLSPEHREVVVLRYYLDLTVEQVAARTGASAGTVKSRLHYALRYLRSAVEPGFEGSRFR